MESQAQTPSLQNLRIPKRRGGWAPACTSTEQHLQLQQQRERQWHGLPEKANGIEDSREKKTTETEARSPLATAYPCTVPGGLIPAKFGFQPIKLELKPLAHTYPAKYVRVHFRLLGVYKDSRVAYRAT